MVKFKGKEFDKEFPTAKLVHHKNNEYLYQDEPDEEFIESIRRSGIKTPLSVEKKTKTILSGHKRHKAAVLLGIETVPVVFESGLYEDEVLMFLVDANRQRERTREAKMREAALVNSAESKRRWRLKNDAKTAGAAPPTFDDRPIDVAARQVGVSPRTVQHAVQATEAIEAAEAAGDTERANEIKTAAATSIKAAAKAAGPKAPGKPKPKPAKPKVLDQALIRKSMTGLKAAAAELVAKNTNCEVATGGPGHYSTGIAKAMVKVQKFVDEWDADIR